LALLLAISASVVLVFVLDAPKVADTPAGKPNIWKLTALLKLPVSVTLIVVLALDPPAARLRLLGERPIEKPDEACAGAADSTNTQRATRKNVKLLCFCKQFAVLRKVDDTIMFLSVCASDA
jgi:hypothetical protein